jgi:hypothetical protein
MKTCRACGVEKPLDEFYADRRADDGKRSECKACNLLRKQIWEADNRAVVNARKQRWRARHGAVSIAHQKKWRRENLEKVAAQRKLRKQVGYGNIIRSDACENCGAEGKPHGHHDDYSKPLEVRWLCAKCHKDAHLVLAAIPVPLTREAISGANGLKTHYKHGHPFDEQNTYIDALGYRHCRTCDRTRHARAARTEEPR